MGGKWKECRKSGCAVGVAQSFGQWGQLFIEVVVADSRDLSCYVLG
jgi:hypothetical protein